MQIKFILHSLDKKEIERVGRLFRKKSIEYYFRNGAFLIYEDGEKVENILKRWVLKYESRVYKLKEWL